MKIINSGHISLLLIAAMLCISGCSNTTDKTGSGDEVRFISNLMAKMTLEEKLGQLNQLNSDNSTGPGSVNEQREELLREGQIGSFLNELGSKGTRRWQKIAVEESRLGIPLIFGFDVIHGFRTIFPIPLAESAAWNPVGITLASQVAAREASAAGQHWTFAPMVDLAWEPRWGRIAEGAGEDPYLGSVMAAARVRGFQGANLADSATILACVKHFAGYGGAQGGRDYNTVDMSMRSMYQYYLPPFKAGIAAGAGSAMSAFNELSGIPMSAHKPLISGLLREQWQWDGFVVSDWTAIWELINHRYAADSTAAGRLALEAGVDMEMVSEIYVRNLPQLFHDGTIDMAVLDESVSRVLRAKYRLGLFDDPYKYCDPQREATELLTAEHRALARQTARESIVLLKNDGILPLAKSTKSIAVIGPLADDQGSCLGTWKGDGRPEEAITILTGLRLALGTNASVRYAAGSTVRTDDRSMLDAAVALARESETIVMVIGEDSEMSGEAHVRSSLRLPGIQLELVKAIHELGKPYVVVLMNGRPLALPWIAENTPAIVESWHLGTEMGNAVADVLLGDYNPGGKLTVSFPRATGQIPVNYNHKTTGRPGNEGNRYTSKYIDLPLTPLYPFGYGLSYTTFEYSDIAIEAEGLSAGDSITAAVTISNTGDVKGDEVVQLYVRDEFASITPPVKELKGFYRLALISGESRRVTFKVPVELLAFYDYDLNRIVEPGEFELQIGAASVDIKFAEKFSLNGAAIAVAEKDVFYTAVSVE